MARVKVTQSNIKSKIQEWSIGQNILDELVFINNSIDANELINQAWNFENMIIEIHPDSSGFSKFIYKEKL